MKIATMATSVYAILLLIGGIVGYFVAHSMVSLIMGSLFAVLTGFAAWGMSKNCYYSKILAVVLVALLLGFFSYRFALTMKFFPSGIMLLLSAGLLVILLLSKKKSQNSA